MKPNVLFLVIDSLRQDKCIGKNKSSFTPNLDKLIESGTFFSQTISAAPITIPSLSSIFTGTYPFQCTTLDNGLYNLKSNMQTYIRDFMNSNYNTYSLIPDALSHTQIPKLFNESDFFDSFSTLYDGLGEKILEKIRNFPNNNPWLFYIHLEDLHGSAIFHFKNNEEIIKNYSGKNQYEKMLSAIDLWLGKFLKLLEKSNTIIIITSDHGSTSADYTNEMFKFNLQNDLIRKHDQKIFYKIGHKFFSSFPKQFEIIRKKTATAYTKNRNKNTAKKLSEREHDIEKLNPTQYQKRLLKKSVTFPNDCYDENFRPALLFYGPNVPKNKIIHNQISSIDIFPTILELLKINSTITSSGRSVLSLFTNGNFEEKPVFLDSSLESTSKLNDTIGVRTNKFKYFRHRNDSNKNVHLFDLENDPFELCNICTENANIVKSLENELLQINPSGDFTFKKTNELNKDDTEKAKEILRQLGYIK